MQVSAISAENGQVSRALGSDKLSDKKDDYIKNVLYRQIPSGNTADLEQDVIKKEIQNWKNFCHQQILKGKLDIIA